MMRFLSLKRKTNALFFATLLVAFPSESYCFNLPESVFSLTPNKHAQINGRVQRTLSNAWKDFENGQEDRALNNLERIVRENSHNPVAVSHALYAASQILAQLEKYDVSINLIKALLRLASLDQETLGNQALLLAQLYIQKGDFDQAGKVLQSMVSKLESQKPADLKKLGELYYLLSYSQFQTEDFLESIRNSNKALAAGDSRKEELLQLQLNSYLSLKDFSASDTVIRRLVSINPNELSYWQQWVRVSLQLNDSHTALSSLELIKSKYRLAPSEVLHYAQLQLQIGSPLRAAQTLSEAWKKKIIKHSDTNLRMLAFCWQQAGDIQQAIDTLSKNKAAVADQSTKAQYERLKLLVQLLSRQQSWPQIVKELKQTTGTSLSDWLNESRNYDPDKAWISLELGRALFYAGAPNQAKETFTHLLGHLNEQKNTVQEKENFKPLETEVKQWLDYLAGQRPKT